MTSPPDMEQLRREGVPLPEAIAICEAYAAAHQVEPELEEPQPERKLNLAMYVPPLPRVPQHMEPVGELSALSLLHTLCQMIDSGRPDVTLLVHSGFSPHTAEELTSLIHSAHPRSVA